ncbi:sodium:alanine symporter family protein [uncultured Cetobacterium sp.]|uniref:alanine/glycine:cation symporter family protein n=2 Tax=uncultured Cetobacterium sp. TaxID=527638 RepID=UPI00260FADB4|nr:alanine/glycine:cation symporter family protein [uncultured Cetobacterium sp.]
MNFINFLNNILWSYVLIVVLIASGLYFTFKLKFANLTQIKEMFKVMLEKGSGKGVSPFQAFCISAGSKVGTGSLAGVALAISVGGPGSVFWMWILALVAGSLSLVENTLAQIYKKKEDGIFVGGPAYYMELGMKKKGLGIAFSILITITYGFIFNAVQANTITVAFKHAYGIEQIYGAIILTVLTGIIIWGGASRIAKVSEVIVPIMGALYLIVAIFIILKNISELPRVMSLILTNAFTTQAATGGTLGVVIMEGIKRGLFSNEAGMGSTPNAGASASTTHPFKQGLVQTLGVYVTTLAICSATAFIILFSGVLETTNHKGIELTQSAMTAELGVFGRIFLISCIFLFAFSSVIGNYFYGIVNIAYTEKKALVIPFKILALAMVFWGSMKDAPSVWAMADLFMAFMALFNIYAITKLRKPAIESIHHYLKERKAGKNPVFTKDVLSNSSGIECWDDKGEISL